MASAGLGNDHGRVKREDPKTAAVALDFATVVAAGYFPLWWWRLPSLHEVAGSVDRASELSQLDFWTSLWLPLVTMLAIMGIAAALPYLFTVIRYRLRDGLLPIVFRWCVIVAVAGGVAFVVGQRSGLLAAAAIRDAQTRSAELIASLQQLERDQLNKQDTILKRQLAESEFALADATPEEKEILQQRIVEINAETERVNRKREQLEKWERKRKAENEKQQAELVTTLQSAKNAREKAASLQKEAEAALAENERAARILAAALRELEESDGGDSDLEKAAKIAGALSLAELNPFVAAAVAKVFGLSFGTKTEEVDEGLEATRDAFQGGTFDSSKARAAVTRLKNEGKLDAAAIVVDVMKHRASDGEVSDEERQELAQTYRSANDEIAINLDNAALTKYLEQKLSDEKYRSNFSEQPMSEWPLENVNDLFKDIRNRRKQVAATLIKEVMAEILKGKVSDGVLVAFNKLPID